MGFAGLCSEANKAFLDEAWRFPLSDCPRRDWD